MPATTTLRQKLASPGALGVVGVHDGVTARLVANAGLGVAFVSGAGVSMSRLGKPDLGYLALSDLADAVRAMSEAAPTLNLIVDMDTGFGNALNAAQAVRTLERAGASALQMEDQTFPKRCGHLAGKSVIDPHEMAGKIASACQARASRDTLIFARTDSLALYGLDDALMRGELYLEAGADALFIEAPASLEQMTRISDRFATRIPLIHNLVEGGQSPVSSIAELDALSYKIGLFPLMFMQVGVPAWQTMLSHVQSRGQTRDAVLQQFGLTQLNAVLGLSDDLEVAQSYGADDDVNPSSQQRQTAPLASVK